MSTSWKEFAEEFFVLGLATCLAVCITLYEIGSYLKEKTYMTLRHIGPYIEKFGKNLQKLE